MRVPKVAAATQKLFVRKSPDASVQEHPGCGFDYSV